MRLLPALLLALAAAAAAQPAPEAVLDAWAADWRRAAADVVAVEARERSVRTVDGPRGRVRVETDADLTYGRDGRPDRDVRSVTVDGRAVAPGEDRVRRRWQRAFGPAGREVQAPARLPEMLARARAVGIAADRVDGAPAWRVRLATPFDRAEAWFTQGARPRLLGARFEGDRPRGGRIVREVRYVRVDGLDVPARATTTFTAQQRRRLRQYHVTLTAEATYDRHAVRR